MLVETKRQVNYQVISRFCPCWGWGDWFNEPQRIKGPQNVSPVTIATQLFYQNFSPSGFYLPKNGPILDGLHQMCVFIQNVLFLNAV